MGRLIAYIIWMVVSMILSIFLPRRRSPYRRSIYGRNYYEESHTFDYLRMFIRRRRALSKVKRFLKKKKNVLTLKNDNVMFIFDTKLKTFALLDVKNLKRSATVIWDEQKASRIPDIMDSSSNVDTAMEITFDIICRSFNDISNYLGILQVLKTKFDVIKENTPKEEPPKTAPAVKPENKIKKEKVNINALDESELSKLPGISIIQAKKIIDRINLKGDFSSVEEFYNEMKIKPHFQKQLDDLILAKPVERKKNTYNEDRIIDL